MSVKFCPQLGVADIKEEAVRLVTKALEAKAKYEFEQAQLAAKKSALEGLAEEEDAKVGSFKNLQIANTLLCLDKRVLNFSLYSLRVDSISVL